MRRIEGRAQHYAWGSTTDIPQLLGMPATDQPYAEHWFGAHESAPSLVDGQPLDQQLAADPGLLGEASRSRFGPRLPYLVKFLAAAHPLSIQAHPDRAQAKAGYAAEEAALVPIGSPERTYRDPWPKPECVIALTTFHGLGGFREPGQTVRLFEALGVARQLNPVISPLSQRRGSAAVAEAFFDVLSLEGERLDLVDLVVQAAQAHADDPGEVGLFARTAIEIDEQFPHDRGTLAALLLNRFTLEPGQGMFLPPGSMHAYLRGFALEVMANSDNVLRGGLTSKHIDIDGLLTVVDFSPHPLQPIVPVPFETGVRRYPTQADEFAVWTLGPAADTTLPGGGARILVVAQGTATLSNETSSLTLTAGQAAFVPATEQPAVMVAGTAYLAGHGLG